MNITAACLLPFTFHGDTAQCWMPVDHEGPCGNSMLTRTTHVLDLQADGHFFVSEDRETRVFFDAAAWADMGKPSQVTVTIEPGDRLNP